MDNKETEQTAKIEPRFYIGDLVYAIVGTNSLKRSASITRQRIDGYSYEVAESGVEFAGYIIGEDDGYIEEKYVFDTLEEATEAARAEIANIKDDKSPLGELAKVIKEAMEKGNAKIEVIALKKGSDDE